MQRSVKAELLQLGILLILDAGFYFWFIPAGIQDPEGIGLADGMAPSGTARIGAVLIALIIIIRLAKLVLAGRADGRYSAQELTDADDEQGKISRPLRSIACIGLCFIYALFLLPLIGFYPASLLLLALLMAFLGERRWVHLLLLPAATVFFVYLLFAGLFSIRLPAGLLVEFFSG